MSRTRQDVWRHPAVWIAALVVCGGGALFAATNFARAFPIISLDIRMDRAAALASAAELAARYGWGPDDYHQAASFSLVPEVQEFLELEGGGVEAFRDALGRDDFHPYRWRVRHFRQLERTETTVTFAPDGTPYGFREQLPEDAPGAALEAEAARAIAAGGVADWHVNLADYTSVESSQETRPGGRIDHTFVYERNGVRYNEGRLRLRLVVGGDRLTELTHFLEVPEAFNRRYAEMRSTNELIGAVAQVAAFLGYLFGACAVALFFLYRDRWVLWKRPLMWGTFIALLQALVVFNQLPLAWMGYDTALSSSNFLIQQVGLALLNFVVYAGVFTVSFMAAESMTRRAFPGHVQLWRAWSPGVANTRTIAGQTVLGYLLLGGFFGYEVFLYYVAQNRLGWWTPSGALTDPDVLAAHFPWFNAIAMSLQAGFWEESLFRAVPIAGAALLGRRFGRPRLWIVGAFVVQTLIFGAGHAAYPTQPAYARLVELIIPSIGFGLVYLLFGLMPGIVLHFAFDVTWFAMPLFASSAPGVWVDRTMVIVLTLVPLWVVLVRRARAGGWAELPPEARNAAWQPPPAAEVEELAEPVADTGEMSPAVRRLLPVAGIAGLVLWASFTGFALQEPGIIIGRPEAVRTARQELQRRGIELSEEWRTLSQVATGVVDQQHRFVWQEGGPEAFAALRGSYLRVPRWVVRFARFEGDVAERAEEYFVVVDGDGSVSRFVHRLPEARPGADLSEDDARQIAGRAVREAFGVAFGAPAEGGGLIEVSAETAARPARRDWTFTFEDRGAHELPSGSARIAVEVAGDEVTEINRFVYVPEDWARADRDSQVVPGALSTAGSVVGVLIVLAGAVAAGVGWARGRFSVRGFVMVLAIVLTLGVVDFINSWPVTVANLSTAMPIAAQIVVLVAGTSIGVVGLAAVMGLLAGWLRRQQVDAARHLQGLGESLWVGVSLGLFAAGIRTALAAAGPSLAPPWGAYGVADAFLPAAGTALASMTGFVTTTLFLVLVFSFIGWHTADWTRRTTAATAMLLALGFLATRNTPIAPLGWTLSVVVLGAAAVAAYVLVLRYDLAVLPAAVAAPMILVHARWVVLDPYPGARSGSIAAIVLLGAAATLAVAWLRGGGDAGEVAPKRSSGSP